MIRPVAERIRERYTSPSQPLRDRLYFMFGTAGTISAAAAFAAAMSSGLPWFAAAASLACFFVMFVLMTVSLFLQDATASRCFCAVFLNLVMFPILFWVTGGVDCGMFFYFILGLCVATLILEGRTRSIVLALSLISHLVHLYLGFQHPHLAYAPTYAQRWADTIISFLIVSLFIVAAIRILVAEYQQDHTRVLEQNESLRRLADTDGLTGLLNRRCLMGMLARLAGSGQTASIVMFDLDDFKQINDRYGHIQGDRALGRFARRLDHMARHAGGAAARYGGEEFIVALPGKGQGEAVAFGEQVRLAVLADADLQALTGDGFSISGGAAAHAPGMTVDAWIHQADQNLYAAKEAGKNRTIG